MIWGWYRNPWWSSWSPWRRNQLWSSWSPVSSWRRNQLYYKSLSLQTPSWYNLNCYELGLSGSWSKNWSIWRQTLTLDIMHIECIFSMVYLVNVPFDLFHFFWKLLRNGLHQLTWRSPWNEPFVDGKVCHLVLLSSGWCSQKISTPCKNWLTESWKVETEDWLKTMEIEKCVKCGNWRLWNRKQETLGTGNGKQETWNK